MRSREGDEVIKLRSHTAVGGDIGKPHVEISRGKVICSLPAGHYRVAGTCAPRIHF